MTNIQNFEKWGVDMEKAKKKLVGVPLINIRNKIAMDLMKYITDRTPVDTGRAKANTHASAGSPSFAIFDFVDTIGGATIAAAAQIILDSTNPYEKIFIQNNLPYIRRLEHGWSAQARDPDGMFGLAVAQVEAEFS